MSRLQDSRDKNAATALLLYSLAVAADDQPCHADCQRMRNAPSWLPNCLIFAVGLMAGHYLPDIAYGIVGLGIATLFIAYGVFVYVQEIRDGDSAGGDSG